MDSSHRRYQTWVRTGVFNRVLEALAEDCRERGHLDLSEVARLNTWLQNYRRVLVRWAYHLEIVLGFVQLACVFILLRHL